MIKIDLNRKRLNRDLEELENDYNNGSISKKEYFARKRDIGQEIETLQAADHVRRMQGRMGSEKSLDYWSDQDDEKKKLADEAEKEEMLKKYITNPDSIKGRELPSRSWFGTKAKIGLVAFILIAFVVGTSLGSIFISKPSETPSVSMVVNDSAFLPTPVNNTTTSTNTNVTKTTQTTTKTTQTNTQSTPTTPQTNTATNTQTNSTG
jgi:hypothetical protein